MMRWYSRFIIVGEIRARATVGSKFSAFSGLLKLLARGLGSDGVIFAEELGSGQGKGEGDRIDHGQGRVRISSLNLSHVRAIDVATSGKFFLADSKFFTTGANIESEVLRNIHDFYVYVTCQ